MSLKQINGIVFKQMVINGANNLANRSKYVDQLNVFPVPDGDTGTNMSMTMTAGAKELVSLEEASIGKVAKVLSRGLLMGARGNSGVILSQLFRGFATGLEGKDEADIEDIKRIITPCGNMNKKSVYIKEIAQSLVKNFNGIVPNERDYLESLPGVGRKTANVVLSNIYNVPAIAVDTHVSRVSVRLGLAKKDDDVMTIERKLMKKFPKDKWIKLHHQLLLFGRHTCKSQTPLCSNCPLAKYCKYNKCI